jgi:hypothetical protein
MSLGMNIIATFIYCVKISDYKYIYLVINIKCTKSNILTFAQIITNKINKIKQNIINLKFKIKTKCHT